MFFTHCDVFWIYLIQYIQTLFVLKIKIKIKIKFVSIFERSYNNVSVEITDTSSQVKIKMTFLKVMFTRQALLMFIHMPDLQGSKD